MSSLNISWQEVPDLDVKEYIVQHTSTNGTCSISQHTDPVSCINAGGDWSSQWDITGTEVFRGRATSFNYIPESLVSGTHYFLVKALDDSNMYSELPGYKTIEVVSANWSDSQKVSYKCNQGLLTLSWSIPETKQFNILGYKVSYQQGVEGISYNVGQGTTEGKYLVDSTITFPVTWGVGETGSSQSIRTFTIEAVDTMGNTASNTLSISIEALAPLAPTVTSLLVGENSIVSWNIENEPEYSGVGSSGSVRAGIEHYKVSYKDWDNIPPSFDNNNTLNTKGNSYTEKVTWGPSILNNNGSIEVNSGSSKPKRRYWVIPEDASGAYGLDASNAAVYIDVTIDRPNSLNYFTHSDFSTPSSNGVVDIFWELPSISSLPLKSIKIYWEEPIWDSSTSSITVLNGGIYNLVEQKSVAGETTKYSTPADWGPTQTDHSSATRSFWFICVDTAGNISIPAQYSSIQIDNPHPVENLVSQVIDNNVILSWQQPTSSSLPISSYAIYRCPSSGTCDTTDYLSTAQYIANVGTSNTYTFFETSAGEYKYFVTAYDSAGNYSEPLSKSTYVNEPRDFELLDQVTSKFTSSSLNSAYCDIGSGSYITEVSCENAGGNWVEESQASWNNILALEDTTALVPIPTETWLEHGTRHGILSSNTIQDLINSTHEYYLTPTTNATYWQKWDLGTEVPQSTTSLIENIKDYSGSVGASVYLYYLSESLGDTLYNTESLSSTTGWVAVNEGDTSFLVSNIRYLKVKIVYTSTNNSFREILEQSIDLKLRTIRDQSMASSSISWGARSNGKVISFNKTFQDINSISVTPQFLSGGNNNGNQNTAIYDFEDTSNPTSFTVYLLDAVDGSFADGFFTWQATGV